MARRWRTLLWGIALLAFLLGIGWVWQFAIFAAGSLPAVGMIVLVSMHPRGTDAAGG